MTEQPPPFPGRAYCDTTFEVVCFHTGEWCLKRTVTDYVAWAPDRARIEVARAAFEYHAAGEKVANLKTGSEQ